MCVEIHPSARKHGIDDADIRHAIEFALAGAPIEGRPGERRLVVGPARTGNLLEVVVVRGDGNVQLVIHAMPLRSRYHPLLARWRPR